LHIIDVHFNKHTTHTVTKKITVNNSKFNTVVLASFSSVGPESGVIIINIYRYQYQTKTEKIKLSYRAAETTVIIPLKKPSESKKKLQRSFLKLLRTQ
jgi:hypothetical protein